MMHNYGLKTKIKNQNYAHSENILYGENTPSKFDYLWYSKKV